MRIGFVCKRLHPNYVDSLQALSRHHDVTVFCENTGFENERTIDLRIEEFDSFSMPSPLSLKMKRIPSIDFLLNRLTKSHLDVVYTREPDRIANAVKFFSRLRGLKILYYNQQICPLRLEERKIDVFPLIEAHDASRAQEDLPENFIPLTINLSRDFGDTRCPPHDRYSEMPLRLMHVGKLIERKGQAIIFEAVSSLVERGINLHLSMYSHTPGNAHLEKMRHSLAELGIAGHVEFIPPKSPEAMLAEYAKHHLFVYSGWVHPARDPDEETYARATGACGTRLYSLIEAMAAGLPVVCASERHVVGAVENGGNGLVFEKGDATDLAAKIEAILHMDLAAMGARSRALIEAHHDAKDFPGRFERLVQALYPGLLDE